MVDRGLREGWITNFPIDKRFEKLPEIVHDAIDDAKAAKDTRSVFLGAGIVLKMMETNLSIAATVDKIRGNAAGEDNKLTVTYANRIAAAVD